jgi:hypothetical protein
VVLVVAAVVGSRGNAWWSSKKRILAMTVFYFKTESRERERVRKEKKPRK